MTAAHCETCICDKRAPVQREYRDSKYGERAPGSITWAEHLQVYERYAARYGTTQSAERLAERGGFSYGECVFFLGHEPKTWNVR